METYFPQQLPRFPPKKWFADMTVPENVDERKQLLLEYYEALIKLPTVLCARAFLDGHEMSESISTAFVQALASMS
jgi:PX domain